MHRSSNKPSPKNSALRRRLPRPVLIQALTLLTLAFALPIHAAPARDLEQESTEQLEQRQATIDSELKTLAGYTMRSGVGSIGYRSGDINDTPQWVQIDLEKSAEIDQVVLVPEIWRGSDEGFTADGFPLEFQIKMGRKGDSLGSIVAHKGPDDALLPRIAPVVINIPATTADWVRIEAITLSPRAWDNTDCLQLAEVLLFSGHKNVALHQQVEAQSGEDLPRGARNRKYLVDGFMAYAMDSNQGKQSVAFLSAVQLGTQPTISIDLEAPSMVDQINLHTVEVSDTIPQAMSNDFAIPRMLVVEGSLDPDFKDAVFLTNYQRESIYDTGPIICKQFPATLCQYVRIRVTEPYIDDRLIREGANIGFAEIEILSKGQNLALDKQISNNFNYTDGSRPITALTDGQSIYGTILPIRDWLEQLALRHDLESEKPQVTAILKTRYAKQKENLTILLWLVAILVAGTIIIILLYRMSNQRAIYRNRQRIAADLHDELGANLHALGLLSDLTQKATNNPEKLANLLQRIRKLTRRCGSAARYCTDMLEAKELYQDVQEQMERTSRRFLTDIEYTISFEGSEFLDQLTPRQRVDLCLFHKECLANILRHAEATQVTIELKVTKNDVHLSVSDNGVGIGQQETIEIPKSIQRRSRLLGSRVRIETPQDGGTRIVLHLNLKKFGLL